MFRSALFFLFLVIALSSSAQTVTGPAASIQNISIKADSMDRDTENETVDLEGNVQLIYQDQHLICEKAHINLRAKTIDAIGNVTVTTPKAKISGQRVILDYESNTGLILEGYVQSGNVLFEGSQIQKLNDDEYVADNARYTTCTTCPEAWSFTGQKIRAEIGGYAYIKSSTLRIASLPVFWMPYLAVPLKTDRQSGLLTPSIGQLGESGLTYTQGYFWAMSRSQDSTWTLRNYELRGPKGLVNYRYVLSDTSSGELDLGFLEDRLFSAEERLNLYRSDDAKGDRFLRWYAKYQHYYEMPGGFVHRAYLNNTSDLQYPKDFSEETGNYGDPAMESRTSLTKNTDKQHYSLDASYYRNLLQSDPLSSNDNAVHRLPELRFSQTQSRIGNSDFLYSLDLNYVNFARSGFAWDDIAIDPATGSKYHQGAGPGNCNTDPNWEKNPNCYPGKDGIYNEGQDLIRTGQRLDIQPVIYSPFKFKNLDILPKFSYRETKYTFPVGEETHNTRRYLRADISARTTFSRIYGDFSSLQSERIKHEIQPEASATTIPWIHHPRTSFFGDAGSEDTPFLSSSNISNADLDGPSGLQFDYNDRLYDRKLVTFGMTNKLTRKYWQDGAPVYLQFVTWRLAQSYDLYQAERNPDSQPLSDLLSDLRINLNFLEIYQQSNFYPYHNVTNSSTRVRVNNKIGDFLQVQHSLAYSISPGQEVIESDRQESYIFTAKKSLNWLDLIGKVGYGINPTTYLNAWGYAARVRLPGDCLYFGIDHYKPVDRKPNFELSVHFAWDGSSKPPLDESLLTRFGF